MIKNAAFEFDQSPIDSYNTHPELQQNSKAYLRQMLKIDEMLGQRLASMQNIQFYLRLMEELRNVI